MGTGSIGHTSLPFRRKSCATSSGSSEASHSRQARRPRAQGTFWQVPGLGSERSRDLIALDDALNALAIIHARKARVIELRFFGGSSVEETAEILKVSADTVLRDWRLARAWLLAELGNDQTV